MMKKRILIFAGIVILAVSAVLIYRFLINKEAAITFNTVKVERGNIYSTVTATGTIEAIKTVNVGTQVSGILEHIYVDFNDNVKQGQLLARLDETSLRAQVDQSQSQVDQAQALLTFQEATYKRLKVLYDKQLIALSDFDQALFNYEDSKASLSSAKSALSRAMVNLEYATITSPIDGVVLNRAVEEGQTVAASFNTPTLFTIVNDLTQMEVQTSVDEADIGKIKQDQRVEFTVDAYPDMKFEGNVSELRLQPVTTNNVVTYVVILSAPNPEKKLMPGMTASATIYVEEKENTLVLSGKGLRFTPDAAYLKKLRASLKPAQKTENNPKGIDVVRKDSNQLAFSGIVGTGITQDGTRPPALPLTGGIRPVWLMEGNDSIRPVNVKTGIDNGSSVEILSGLNEGDEVVISMSTAGAEVAAVKNDDGPPGPFPF
jgi:HlyD family secretion protein